MGAKLSRMTPCLPSRSNSFQSQSPSPRTSISSEDHPIVYKIDSWATTTDNGDFQSLGIDINAVDEVGYYIYLRLVWVISVIKGKE